jgi:lipopolysaccharide export system permease protein
MRLFGLRPVGQIDRYVAALFVGAYFTSLLLVVGLAVIIDVASNLDYFAPWPDGQPAPTSWILRYYALNTPFLFLQVAPFVTVSAALFTVVKLTRHNELVACLNAGVSARRTVAPIFVGGLLAALGMIALREAATHTLGPERDRLRHLLDTHTEGWRLANVRSRDVYGNVFGAKEFHPDRGEVVDMWIVGRRGPTVILLSAQRAQFVDSGASRGWVLEGGVLSEETGDTSARSALEWFDAIEFTPDDLLLADKGDRRALELSLAELERLAVRDPDNLQYQTLFHYNVTFPLANLVLLLITLPFLFGRERGKSVEGLARAALMCVLYFACDFIARSLGMEGAVTPLWSSWIVILTFGSLGVVLFEGLRT